jgi:hypothetical protein
MLRTGVCFLPLFCLLAFLGMPFKFFSSSFIRYDSPSRQIPLPLVRTSEEAGRFAEQIELELEGEWNWNQVQAINLLFFTSQTSPVVTKAALESDSGCRLVATEPWLSRQNLLRFRHPDVSSIRFILKRGTACDDQARRFVLKLERTSGGQLGLWAHDGSVKTSAQSVKVIDRHQSLPREALGSVLMGRVIMKQDALSESALSLFGKRFLVAGPLGWIALGLCLGVFSLVAHIQALRIWPLALRISLTLCFAQVSLLTAFLLPPFQGADEPDHFLGLTSEQLHAEALNMAQSSDFERIKFRYLETSNPPYESKTEGAPGWSFHVHPIPQYEVRSPTVKFLYQIFAPLILNLYSARMLGLIVFFLTMLGLIIIGKQMEVPHPLLLGGALSGIICFPVLYFSSVVSNYSILASLCILYAGTTFFILLRPHKSLLKVWPLALLSLVAFLIYATSVNGVGIYFFHFVLAMFIALIRLTKKQRLVQIGYFWAVPLVITSCVILVIPLARSDAGLMLAWEKLASILVPDVAQIPSAPLFFIRFLFLASPYVGLLLLEWLLRQSPALSFFKSRSTLRAQLLSTVVILSSLYVFARYESVQVPFLSAGLAPEHSIDTSHINPIRYAYTISSAVVDSLQGDGADFMTVQSFWGGFGWLDQSLPLTITSFFMLLTYLGILCMQLLPFCRLGRAGAWLNFCFILAFLGSVVTISAQALGVGIDVVGRYMLVPYVVLVTVSLLSLFYSLNLASPILRRSFIIVIVSLPVAAILTILDRYYLIFGGNL